MQRDNRWDKPLWGFCRENVVGTVTAFAVYAFFRIAEWGFETLNTRFPVHEAGPSVFLAHVFSWGGAIAAAILWLMILLRTLQRYWRATGAQELTNA